jgi:hypothetical protein
LGFEVRYYHHPSNLDQIGHPFWGGSVRVNLRSEIGRLGLIVRIGGSGLGFTLLPQNHHRAIGIVLL